MIVKIMRFYLTFVQVTTKIDGEGRVHMPPRISKPETFSDWHFPIENLPLKEIFSRLI